MDTIFNKEVDIIECGNSKVAHDNGLYNINKMNEEVDIRECEHKQSEIDFVECEQINEDTVCQDDNSEPVLLCD